ncbi:DUF5723 family protein [Lewinella sp. JB7]|uniref:DUF5723 family protein n=1 Tax=Lewinella sp. JB7 TaxID=2962887 RepID=UPI0020C9E40B|nr:DUF5723 family protein [Lewinella sp. JB7]MCP9234839.1 DUF5723 family protein [Lewinella sp. JB7]
MRTPFPLLWLSLVLASAAMTAQTFPGLTADNYAGVHGLLLNPASIAGSRTASEIHLGSVAATVNNDYLTFRTKELGAKLDDEFESLVLQRNPGSDRSLNGAVDVLGPSLLISFGKHTGVGLLTRARTMYSGRNFSGQLMEGIQGNLGDFNDFSFDQRDHHTTLHAWGEVGLAIATEIVRQEKHVVKAGATFKYLQGLGAVFTYGDALTGAYDANREELDISGDVTFGRSQQFYVDDLTFDNRAGGFGLDLGVIYEWRPTAGKVGEDGQPGYPHRPYRLKVAASLMDLGKISYDDAYMADYRVNGTIPLEQAERGDVEAVLDDNFGGTYREAMVAIGLPTTLNLLVDYRVTEKLYVSGLYTSPAGPTERLSTNLTPTVTFAPRLEGRVASLYLPYSMRAGQDNTLGLGMRFGFLTVGSGSIVSSFLSDGAQAADVFVGLKLPFHRKFKKDKASKGKGGDAGAVAFR